MGRTKHRRLMQYFALVPRRYRGSFHARPLHFESLEPRRLLAAGDLDPTFGIGGKVTTDFANGNDRAFAVAIQDDGKVIVVGTVGSSRIPDDFALARYNVDGTLDVSFGDDGRLTADFGGGDRARSVIIQNDGKIVVAGTYAYESAAGNFADFALSRYNPDGTLDSSFDGDGLVATDFREIPGYNYSLDYSYSMALQSDGKIIVVGTRWPSHLTRDQLALARYNVDGSLDSSFDVDGKLTSPVGWSDIEGFGVAVQSDGRILVVGRIKNGSTYDFAVVRFNTDGSLDTSFGSGGKVTTAVGISNEAAQSVALQNDGKIVVAGYGVGGIWAEDFALARYHLDGTLDTSFGINGKVITDFGLSVEFGRSLAIQPDGKIVVVGYSSDGIGMSNFAVARYNATGTLDLSFCDGGLLITAFGISNSEANCVALQDDGKIVVAGLAGNDFALARYESASTSPSSITGDYNLNGIVDSADFGLWRKTLGTTVPTYSSADGDGDGVVDQDDYDVWRANFGRTTAARAVIVAAAATSFSDVEPSTAARLESAILSVATGGAIRPLTLYDASGSASGSASGISAVRASGKAMRPTRRIAFENDNTQNHSLLAWLRTASSGTLHGPVAKDPVPSNSTQTAAPIEVELDRVFLDELDLAFAAIL